MLHTTQEIIDNQGKFKDKILDFLNKDQKEAKMILNQIKSKDEFILKEKEKLKNRFKKIKVKQSFDKLFFMHPNRSKVFYAWWAEAQNDLIILQYDKE